MRLTGLPILAFVLLVTNNQCLAQLGSTASGVAQTSIITPISLVKTSDLNFGTVNLGGGSNSKTVTSNNNSKTTTSTTGAASFTISGKGDYTFSLSFPDSVIITNGTDTIKISNFSSTSTLNLGGGSGSQQINVGGTMDPTKAKSKTNGTDSAAVLLPIGVNIN